MNKWIAGVLALGISSASIAGNLELGGFSVDWDAAYLKLARVSIPGSLDVNPAPDFEHNDVVSSILEFQAPRPIRFSGADQESSINLPVFNINAAAGWVITSIDTYFVGDFSVTGDAAIRTRSNTVVTFDKDAAIGDKASQSVFPLSDLTSNSTVWYLSDYVTRQIECGSNGACQGAKHVTIDMSKSYLSDIGQGGGATTISFRPSTLSGFSLQWIGVKTERLTSAVPESSTLVLFGVGILFLLTTRMRSGHC